MEVASHDIATTYHDIEMGRRNMEMLRCNMETVRHDIPVQAPVLMAARASF